MKKHLIIGNPIDHSLSPKIHNHWLKKYNINGVYEKFAAKKDELSKIVKKIKNEELFGANITVPFKQSIIPFLDTLSSSAKKTYSVNTIFKKNEKVCGDNTDIVGFELAIQNSNFDFKNKSAFIFGAGGVTPSIIFGLKNLGVDEIFLSNRTLQKVENIKSNFPFINEVKWGETCEFDIIINATSVGLHKEDNLDIDFKKIGKNKFFFDVIYNPPRTNFLKNAEELGHKVLNGKTMFIYQAQKAFEIWHNKLPLVDNDLIKFLYND